MPDIPPLITHRPNNQPLYASVGSTSGYPITQIEETDVIGTITRGNPSVSTTFAYPFKTGVYYVQVEVDLDVTADATSGDLLYAAFAQSGGLGNQIIQSTNATGITSGNSIRMMLTGYINTTQGTNTLEIIVGSYNIGGGSSYQVTLPTDNYIFIQQVA